MTITTAKLDSGAACALRLAPLALAALLCGQVQAQSVPGAEAPRATAPSPWRFTPTVDYGLILTDNVNLQPDERKHGQLIAEVAPGFDARYQGPRLVGHARYDLRLFQALQRDVPGARNNSHSLQSDLRAELADDMLFVDANASISQVGISPFGQTPSRYSSANSAEVTSWRISPYLRNRLGRLATSELRYTRDSVSAGNTGLGDTDGQTVSLSLRSGQAWQDLGFELNASDQTIRDKVRNDSTIQTGNFNLSYRLLRTLSVTAGVNYDNYNYESLGGANGGNGWNAGFTWTPSRRTSLMLNHGQRYYGPSRALKAMHRTRRSVWNISYDDSVTSTRANFLLPRAVDTAALIDSLLLPSFPDPEERARAVEEYIRSSGLPPTLADQINFFSNRFSLQKQLRASFAYRTARTAVVYSVYRIRREALSSSVADSVLLGTSSSVINDNVDQKGFAASLQYSLNSRSKLSLTTDIYDSDSLTTGFTARTRAVRLGLRQRLQKTMNARVELRHVKGATGIVTPAPYTENAISAYLTMQY